MLPAMTTYSRRRLLTTGAVGGMALIAAPAAAVGATPAPVDDDVAYLQIASVAKLVSIALFERALSTNNLLRGDERPLVRAIRRDEVAHRAAIDAVLAADAPTAADYFVLIPAWAFKDAHGVAQFGLQIEEITGGAVLGGAPVIVDSATRALLSRVNAADSQHLAQLRALRGVRPTGGKLPGVMPLERAARRLDAYLTVDAPSARRLAPTLRRNLA